MHGRTPFVQIDPEPFRPFETKSVEFAADVIVKFDRETGQVKTVPLLVHFKDQSGALIRAADGVEKFELDYILMDANDPDVMVSVFPAEKDN
jgi:hypothetical protein